MILIVGASGRLGGAVGRRLLAEGRPVRALSRTPEKLADLAKLGAEVVVGDLRDPPSLARACAGVEMVFASAHAFDGKGANQPRTVDDFGNRALIDAARAAGVEHFVLTSILHARPDHPVDLWRSKAAAERHLRASGLSYTIVRPTAFMELWAGIVAEPIVKQGKALIFGRGTNPVNFVSVEDVAQCTLIGLGDPRAQNQVIEIGGPQNLSLTQLARLIARAAGREAREQHIPLAMMRAMHLLTLPINPAFSRQIAAGIYMDTHDMTFDPAETLRRYPMTLTRMEDVVRARYGSKVAAA